MTLYICITFKTNNSTYEGHISVAESFFVGVYFKGIPADVKMFVVSFTFATQKLTKKTTKQNIPLIQYFVKLFLIRAVESLYLCIAVIIHHQVYTRMRATEVIVQLCVITIKQIRGGS